LSWDSPASPVRASPEVTLRAPPLQYGAPTPPTTRTIRELVAAGEIDASEEAIAWADGDAVGMDVDPGSDLEDAWFPSIDEAPVQPVVVEPPVVEQADPRLSVTVKEFANVQSIRWAQSLLPFRTMRHGCKSYAQSLEALLSQAADVSGEVCSFNVEYHEMGSSRSVGLLGRRFAVSDRSIGAFSLPKVLRYAARMGMPNVVDLDLHAAHACALWDLACGVGLAASSPRLHAIVFGGRDGWSGQHLAPTMPARDIDYESFKVLILAVINGKHSKASWPAALMELAAECAVIRAALAAKHPGIVEKLRATKRDPVVSLTALLMIDRERLMVDLMIAAALVYLMSIEHDGIVVKDAPAHVLMQIKASVPAPWAVHETRYPVDRKAFLKFADERCAGYEWKPSLIDWRDVLAAERTCWKVLCPPAPEEEEEEVKEKFATAHTDFATSVAGRVEGDVFVCRGKVSIYDKVACKWQHDCTDNELHAIVREELHRNFRPSSMTLVDWAPTWSAYGSAPRPLKNHGNLAAVRLEVKSMLVGEPTPPTDSRRFLPFNNALVYDFVKAECFKVHRGFTPERVVPWPYESWRAPAQVQYEFKSVVGAMLEWEKENNGDLVPEVPTGNVELDLHLSKGNPELAARFVAVLEKLPGAAFVTRWFDADGIAYFMKHYVRMMAAEPKFCEMLNIHGPPRAGKDAITALFESFMGSIDENGFGAGLMPDQVQISKGRALAESKQGPAPFTHALKGARSIIVPELKQGVLDMEVLKGLVEQEGGKYTSRECRGNVNRWNPSALLVTVGNYCPDFGSPPVHGAERRVNVLAMTTRFALTADPEALLEAGDFNLKGKINSGAVFNDWFHVTRAFYPFLALYGDKVRQPKSVERDTKDAVHPEGADEVEGPRAPWHSTVFCPADDTHLALTPARVRKLAQAALNLSRVSDASSELKALGFDLNANLGTARCVRFRFHAGGKLVPVAAFASASSSGQ
jgi:hypothetical protein